MPLKRFLVHRQSGRQFRLNGIHRSRRLPGKHHLRQNFSDHVKYSADQLPPSVDFRPNMPPVEDQSQIGSCTANSLAGAYEYIIKKSEGNDIAVSRLFIYYNERAKENPSNITDSGATLTDGIETIEEFGVCLESFWPYDISQVNTKPSDEAYQEAVGHKITNALQVNRDLNEMKSCLAQGFPFAFGLQLYPSFNKATTGGVVRMPSSDELSGQPLGGHALLAVGYSDQSQSFIVRNSWGQDWGDQGYCYIPYDYMTNTEYCYDAWTIRTLSTDDFGQDEWNNDDSVDYRQSNDNDDDNDDDNDNPIEEHSSDDGN
ncbi:unnamed protein product [Adineta ricciae]|uniref:Peptidase C1A papain C-terminal domain-containing protein n=1 Tax=Adineta ricciae TaxID=249248 RepID=A0A813RIM9_ADIRI|nr:unnamed protein product [Adineta ricciae]CAF1422268.1 unnamed protein product [Adineta ricciae]